MDMFSPDAPHGDLDSFPAWTGPSCHRTVGVRGDVASGLPGPRAARPVRPVPRRVMPCRAGDAPAARRDRSWRVAHGALRGRRVATAGLRMAHPRRGRGPGLRDHRRGAGRLDAHRTSPEGRRSPSPRPVAGPPDRGGRRPLLGRRAVVHLPANDHDTAAGHRLRPDRPRVPFLGPGPPAPRLRRRQRDHRAVVTSHAVDGESDRSQGRSTSQVCDWNDARGRRGAVSPARPPAQHEAQTGSAKGVSRGATVAAATGGRWRLTRRPWSG